MSLATTVSIVVLCVLVVVGAIGFLIDKYAEKTDAS
jgi:preprotein translocase subunit Sss1